MTREIGIVPTDRILAAIWPDVDSVLSNQGAEWLAENELADTDVFERIVTSQWQLWLGTEETTLDAVMLTRFDGPELQVLWLGGGRLEHYLLEGLLTLERFALHHEAREVVIGGREGWERLLGRFGYVKKDQWLRKDLIKAYAH